MIASLRLFHISDLHFGAEDEAALEWVRDLVRAERPDAVLVTGDLTMRARSREFAAAVAWLDSLDTRLTIEVGNHDLPYFNLIERFTAPYRRFGRLESRVERELDLPGLAVIPLKTTARAQWRWPWVEGWVRAGPLDRTLAAIAAVPSGTRVLVTAHHPLVEQGPDGRRLTINGNRAMAALARCGVGAVLSGHVHDPFDLTRQTAGGPLRMIGAGTLSQRVRSTPPSFNELHVGPAGISVRVRSMIDASNATMQAPDVPVGPIETAAC